MESTGEESIRDARHALVEAGRRILASSLTVGSWGNLSQRVAGDGVAITPSGRSYESLQDEDIVITGLDGSIREGHLIPSSELPLHLAIYRALPQACAIVHTHSLYASVLAVQHRDLPPLVEDLVQLTGGPVRCAAYALPGTEALGDNVVAALDGHRAALLANHGAVCWGTTLAEALTCAELLEKASHIYVAAGGEGKVFPLSEETCRFISGFYEAHYKKRQEGLE
ncbi:MAG: class II aldolase/adducin family protein [Succiniclasticum sp.]|jgi:L-fuculose-phosphate aldolase